MPNRRTRERQLAKLAARRAAERKRKRRQRLIALAVGGVLLLALVGAAAFFVLREEPKKRAAAGPTAAPSPGSNCNYTVRPDQRSGPKGPVPLPGFTIDVTKSFTAFIKTSKGSFNVELKPQIAPCAVNSFVYLARRHFFDGLTFIRVAKSPPVIQGGDPTGTGPGGPGYAFVDEVSPAAQYLKGVVAMANGGPDTNGSQFFVMTADDPQLPPNYTIFGEVVRGMDVVEKIHSVPVGTPAGPEVPKVKVTIVSVTIKES